MTEVFNAANQPFDQYWNLVFPGGAVLVTLIGSWHGSGRRWLWGGTTLAIFLFLLTFILPLADHRHVQAMAGGDTIRTVEGRISGHKRETTRTWLGSSRGIGVTSHDKYRTTTEEQFWIGTQWFWFEVGGDNSSASFTNAGEPPLSLKDGTFAKISFFNDPWYQGEMRIVRLALGQPKAATGPSSLLTLRDEAFATFWRRFADAVARGDEEKVRAYTRFPFLFSGTPIPADRFVRVWEALFAPAPLRDCLASARPASDKNSWSVSCGVYIYVFERSGTEGWRFAAFTADPEAGD